MGPGGSRRRVTRPNNPVSPRDRGYSLGPRRANALLAGGRSLGGTLRDANQRYPE